MRAPAIISLTFIFLGLLFANQTARSQNLPVGKKSLHIAFYNVENLYDTVPSLFYDDTDYTPAGRYKWDSGRYRNKINNICSVIDAINADIIGLAEIENESVVRDIVVALRNDYNYIHRTGGDRRGMDLAVLYKGDKFIPESIRLVPSGTSREFLYVNGITDYGIRLDLIFCHLPSQLNNTKYREKAMANLSRFVWQVKTDTLSNVIIAGDFNSTPGQKVFRNNFFDLAAGNGEHPYLYFALAEHYKKGMGTYFSNGKWLMLDHIYLDKKLTSDNIFPRVLASGIYAEERLLYGPAGKNAGQPKRTFNGRKRYMNGFSDHLPVYVTILLSGH